MDKRIRGLLLLSLCLSAGSCKGSFGNSSTESNASTNIDNSENNGESTCSFGCEDNGDGTFDVQYSCNGLITDPPANVPNAPITCGVPTPTPLPVAEGQSTAPEPFPTISSGI